MAKGQALTAQSFKNGMISKQDTFSSALPKHIPYAKFQNTAMLAITQNPRLLSADTKSLFGSFVACAGDGLLPDGRQATITMFGTTAQYMPMVGGIIEKLRRSGELITLSANVVYENDVYEYELGDNERIIHKPLKSGDRGKAIAVYANAKLKGGGVQREIMTVDEVEQVRNVSKAKNSGPWKDWWSEMAKKTCIRRLCKMLPSSPEMSAFWDEHDETFEFDNQRAPTEMTPQEIPALQEVIETAPDDGVIDVDTEEEETI